MGETIPKESNYVSLHSDEKDEWDMPQLNVSVDYDDNDEKMLDDFFEQLTEMYESAGFKNIKTSDSEQAPGLDIHEMGLCGWIKIPKLPYLTNGISCIPAETSL